MCAPVGCDPCQVRLPSGRAIRRFRAAAPALQLWAFAAQQLKVDAAGQFDLIGPGGTALNPELVFSREGTFASEGLGGASIIARLK